MPLRMRRAKISDVLTMKEMNIKILPENYSISFWLETLMNSPVISFVFQNSNKKVVGYLLGNINHEVIQNESGSGEIASIATSLTYRGIGIAGNLIKSFHKSVKDIYRCPFSELDCRTVNIPAVNLYKKCGYSVIADDPDFYADGEGGLTMRHYFDQ